ncbi:MAG: DUF4276 family protein [Rhodocyclales bacterium]|nr:DUF4276 family protein [Rhodocyclales bacterium]
MKIGLIFECGPQGADKQVCEYLARKLLPDVELVSKTLDTKPNLLNEAGRVAAGLLADDCDRVLVVWDLRPAWPVKGDKPCRRREREMLHRALGDAGVAVDAAVFFVCIEQELESWLLADERKLSEYLSTPAHGYGVDRVRRPDRQKNPKAAVISHFRTARGQRYDDKVHAVKVIAAGELDWRRLRRSESFARFESKILGRLVDD